MKVTLTSSGGFAAAVRLGRPPLVVDAAGLPPAEAGELAGLVTAARAEEPAPRAERARDAMSHTITVEDGGSSAVLSCSDAAMSPAYADLLRWLHARATPPPGR